MVSTVVLHTPTRPTDQDENRQVYMLQWRLPSGAKRREIIGEVGKMSRRDAEHKRREKESALDKGTVRPDKPASITLANFLEDDRAKLAVYAKPSSIETHAAVSRKVLSILGDRVKLADVSAAIVERIRVAMRPAKGKRATTAYVNKVLGMMRAAFGRAVDRKLIHENPFARSLKGKSQSEPPRVFTHAEIDAMVEAAPSVWWMAFIELGFTTGLRLGELLNLTWDDIDFEAGVVKVQAKRASADLIEFTCKSYAARHVTLVPKAANLLRELRLGMGVSPYLFLSLDRLAALRRTHDATREIEGRFLVNNYLRDFKLIQAAAHIAKLGCVHDLRASYGTHMAARVPMHELQRLMGHADIGTTAKHYLAPTADTAAAACEAFAQAG